ncbi:MAG: type II toxin-antitoxin system HipA family toxin [Verrucomicrobia bacterium]|nr:type II toxin-antitoxin system HipA family toxin [Verrucomicrobiota bacterium]
MARARATPSIAVFTLVKAAEEKTALLKYKDVCRRPTGSTPRTHILKLPIGRNPQGIDLSTSLENERLCAQIVESNERWLKAK